MNKHIHEPCSWSDRVSALIDGELSENEQPLVRAHIKSCHACELLSRIDETIAIHPRNPGERTSPLLNLFPDKPSLFIRSVLFLVGVFILANSMPAFVRGNTNGDALHDLRHLAIWQATIGVAVVFSAFTFKLSRILSVILITFLLLTVLATLYDLFTGHRGPWTDEMHILEVLAVLLLLRLVWPQLRLLSRLNRKKSNVQGKQVGFAKSID